MLNKPEVQKAPANLPFLKAICWQSDDVMLFTPDEMLDCYERGWNYRGVLGDLEGEELIFLQYLAHTRGSWLTSDV